MQMMFVTVNRQGYGVFPWRDVCAKPETNERGSPPKRRQRFLQVFGIGSKYILPEAIPHEKPKGYPRYFPHLTQSHRKLTPLARGYR
jgi:hypothetical protein